MGLWIDHKKAIVVTLKNGTEEIRTIESGADRRVRLSGGSRSHTPYGAQNITSDSQRHARYKKQLTVFYRTLIDTLREAESLYLIGPGRAKNELKREIEKVKPLRGKIVAVETTDKMTDRQIIAAVRSFFRKMPPANHTADVH
jgi:hypothetical protein